MVLIKQGGNPQGDQDLQMIEKQFLNMNKDHTSDMSQNPPSPPDDGKTPKWQKNLKGARDVGVVPHTPEYQQFMLTHKPDSEVGKKYNDLPNRKAQRDFRQKWAEEQYQVHIKEKTHTKAWQTVDTSKGVYLPLARIVQEEGGKDDPENVKAAMKYCRKCMELDGDWVSYNQMTERLEFLHLRREHKDIFKQC